MIHTIHEHEMTKKNKNKYLLDNIDFLFDYYKGDISTTSNKRDINKYLNSTENECLELTESNTCCNIELRMDEGFLICPQCGKQTSCLEINNTFTEHITPVYVRLNHFQKILNQLQGKETFTIKHLPEIKEYIRTHRLEVLDTETIKTVLKKMKLVNYYDHVQCVRKYLDLTVPYIEPELEARLIHLFKQIETQYNVIIPDSRSNFFNYSFVLTKLFTLLNRKEYIPYLQKLKGADKIKMSEKLYRQITLT